MKKLIEKVLDQFLKIDSFQNYVNNRAYHIPYGNNFIRFRNFYVHLQIENEQAYSQNYIIYDRILSIIIKKSKKPC